MGSQDQHHHLLQHDILCVIGTIRQSTCCPPDIQFRLSEVLWLASVSLKTLPSLVRFYWLLRSWPQLFFKARVSPLDEGGKSFWPLVYKSVHSRHRGWLLRNSCIWDLQLSAKALTSLGVDIPRSLASSSSKGSHWLDSKLLIFWSEFLSFSLVSKGKAACGLLILISTLSNRFFLWAMVSFHIGLAVVLTEILL